MSYPVDLMLLEKLGAVLAARVAPLFKPGTRLAIIARTPGLSEAETLVTDDDIDELIALLKRSKDREVVKPPLRQPTPDSRPLLPPEAPAAPVESGMNSGDLIAAMMRDGAGA